MILVDTSAWIAFFRDRGPIAAIVDQALEDDDVALCGPVFTELRRGFKSAAERSKTIPLLLACHQLPQPTSLWNEAGDLGFALARKGVTVKSLDLLIAAFATEIVDEIKIEALRDWLKATMPARLFTNGKVQEEL